MTKRRSRARLSPHRPSVTSLGFIRTSISWYPMVVFTKTVCFPSHLNLWDIKRKPPHGHMPRPLMFFPYTTNSRGRVWMIIFQTRSTLQRLMFRSATRSQTGLLFSKTGDFRVFGPIFNIDKCTVPAILRSVVDTRTIIASWNPELLHVGVYSAVAYNLKHPFLSCPKREFLSKNQTNKS